MSAVDLELLAQKANLIYSKILPIIEKLHKGKYVIIEPDSESYYIRESMDDALKKARQNHQGMLFVTYKIGAPKGGLI